MAECLHALFNFPADGFMKTRDPRLDPPVRVTGVYKESFGLTPSCPERWPEKPPSDWERFFCVDIAVKDAAGAEFGVRVPYKRFAENRDWAKALDLSVTQFCASRALCPTYNNEHVQFVLEEEEAERNRALLQLEDSRAEAREQRNINFEAADRWTAEYEAQQRAARGPTIVEVDEPNESLWTPEEFAEMQAATRADRERKRQAAEGLLFHNKRGRNH